MIIDSSLAATAPSQDRFAGWAARQRVFISSPMGDTEYHRKAVAEAVRDMGATAVLFEDFGGRDDDPEQAYLSEVDSSTIYLAILNERHGRRLPDGYSATEAEYRRALERGKRISVWVARTAPDRDGNLVRFIEDLRTFHVTGSFNDPGDLAAKARNRLRSLAAEASSPWVKLGDFVFRADEIRHTPDAVEIRTRISPDLLRQIEELGRWRRDRVRLTYELACVEGEVDGVDRIVRAGEPPEATIRLARIRPPAADTMRAGTGRYSSNDLIEIGVRHLFLGENLPPEVKDLSFLSDPGVDQEALELAFDLPEEIAESVARLVVADGLVGTGRAASLLNFRVGPRVERARHVLIEWEEPRIYSNVEPRRRRVEGIWRQ